MTPTLQDVLETLRVVALPMHTRFRGVNVREAALFRGPQGWAEFSPFPEYDDQEAATWLRAAIDFAWNEQPAPVRDTVGVNATMPAVAPEQVPEVLARYDGCRTVKVKVAERGQTLTDDVARVRAVREAAPDARIRIDANMGWNVDEAEHALMALREYDLEYVEQPCESVEELAEVRKRVHWADIPIAADESIRKAADPLAVARAGAADLIIVKMQPLGGIRRALEIVAETGLPAVVSSAIDTAVGLSMGVALARALPELDYDCGLGTSSLFVADVADARARGGFLSLDRVEPDPNALDELAASDERTVWWRERITRCFALLQES